MTINGARISPSLDSPQGPFGMDVGFERVRVGGTTGSRAHVGHYLCANDDNFY
jgi:hypothetical protein